MISWNLIEHRGENDCKSVLSKGRKTNSGRYLSLSPPPFIKFHQLVKNIYNHDVVDNILHEFKVNPHFIGRYGEVK